MLPDELRLLDSPDLSFYGGSVQSNPFIRRSTLAVTARLLAKVQSYDQQLQERMRQVYSGTEQLAALENLAKKVLLEDRIERTRTSLKDMGVRRGELFTALDRLEVTVYEILKVRNRPDFRLSTLHNAQKSDAEMTPAAVAVLTSNFDESLTKDIFMFLSLPHHVLTETLLGFDEICILRKRVDEVCTTLPEFVKVLLPRIFKDLQAGLDDQQTRINEALSLFEEMPTYSYSFSDYNLFESHRDAINQRISFINKLSFILSSALSVPLLIRLNTLISDYQGLKAMIGGEALDRLISSKIDCDEAEELFAFIGDWPGFRYPKEFFEAGAYGDMTEAVFNGMSVGEANSRCYENMEKLGLCTFGDFKRKRIFNTQMLSEYLKRTEVRAILNSQGTTTTTTATGGQFSEGAVSLLTGVFRLFGF